MNGFETRVFRAERMGADEWGEHRFEVGEELYGHLEKYPFRAACESDSKNLFEFDHRERVRWGNWVSLI